MNEYVKSIIREEKIKQIIEVFERLVDSYSKDISADCLRQNLLSSRSYLTREIEDVLIEFED